MWVPALALLSAIVGLERCAQPATAPRDPVTLRIGVASPKIASPASGAKSVVSNLMSESLVGIGWDGRPTGRMATVEGWDEEKLKLTLRLPTNLQFHDGTPVDNHFVSKTLSESLKGPYASYRSVVGVDAVDNDKVVIRLSRPEALLLTDLSNSTISHPTNTDIGLGPFRILTRTPRIRLAAFDQYYRGRPSVDFIEVEEYEEQRSPWAALLRGELDAVHEITPGAIDFVQAEGQTTVRTFPFLRPYYVQLIFNVRHPILKDKAVRQALSYAVDRQAIIDLALNRQGTVAEGPIWPYHWAYSTAQKTYKHNAEAATLRLDSAGLKVKPASEPGRMPSRLRFRCLTVAKESRYEKIAIVLQKQMYEIGVDMEIEALPAEQLVARMKSGRFDTILMENTSGRSLSWTYLMFHSSSPFSLGYTSVNGVLDRLRSATGDGDVRSAVSELQQIFHDDPPAIFIAWPQVARAVSTKFVVPDEKGRDVISSMWMWKPADPPR